MITKALSIKQPFVEAILLGLKTIEYRTINTNIRGAVYLYASQTPSDDESFERYGLAPGSCKCGAIEITGSSYNPDNDFFEWSLANPVRFDAPLYSSKKPQPVWWLPELEGNNMKNEICDVCGKPGVMVSWPHSREYYDGETTQTIPDGTLALCADERGACGPICDDCYDARAKEESRRYMVVGTGSVDTRAFWISEINSEEMEAESCASAEETFEKYLRGKKIVEVRKAETETEKAEYGEWMPVE